MIDNLTQLRICLEKPLLDEEHVMKVLGDTTNSDDHFKKARAAFLTQKIWASDSNITISFVSSPNTIKNVDWTPIPVLKGIKNSDESSVVLDPIEDEIRKLSPIEAVKKVVRERIQPLVGLRFKFVSTNGMVRIGFNPHGGTFSLVGTDCLKSKDAVTMNFSWLDAGTIIHEFGHVLGLIHEHQNPNGKSIQWDDSKVYEWAKQTQGWDTQTTYHNIIERYKTDQVNASKYDPHSIMEYFFPGYLTINNVGTPNNHILSTEDVKYISKIYPGGRQSAEEFYTNVYGTSLNNTLYITGNSKDDGESGKFDWKIVIYIFSGIIGIALIAWLFIKIQGRGGGGIVYNKQLNYSEWRQSHGGSLRSFTPKRYT